MQPIGYNKGNLKEIVEVLLNYKKENEMNYLFKDAETSFIEDLKEVFGEAFTIEEDQR